jgi:BMFP domain-containing protein YqiC
LIAARSSVSYDIEVFLRRGINAMDAMVRMLMAEGRILKSDRDRIAELEKRVAELEEKLDTVMRWIGLKEPSEIPD